MREVVPQVYLMEGLRGANAYLLASGGELTLIDGGLPGDADRIADQILESDRALSELRTIVVTHTHGDHAGGVPELARRSGADVVAHRDEVPYIEQTKGLPAESLIQRLLNWMSTRLVFGASGCEVNRAVQDGDVIDALGGLRVVHTFGHTPGSISLYQPEREILFCGDALFNANPMGGNPGLRLPIPLFTGDQDKARDAAAKLAALSVEVLCCGHGEPILEGGDERIRALL